MSNSDKDRRDMGEGDLPRKSAENAKKEEQNVLLATLERVLEWSRERDYAGHSKHDALNSPFLSAVTLKNKILRLVAIQALMRFPWNVRGLFGVPKLRNPKGIGLFAHAQLDLAAHLGEAGDNYREQAEGLLQWLIDNPSPWADGSGRSELAGRGWGYHYPWQDVGFFQPRHYPNRVVSCWIGFAFVRAFEVTGKMQYLDVAGEIVRFVLDNPKRLEDTAEQLCLSYVPLEEIDWAVMDVSALSSSLCAQVARHTGDADLQATARRLMAFVVDKQTDYGAWFYTWPAGDSHITHDNYHTGIIVDCLADYMAASGDRSFEETYEAGVKYYEEALFTDEGAPKWMNDRVFPHDIHGAAAGILCFTRAARYYDGETSEPQPERAAQVRDMAQRVQEWTLANLYRSQGYFVHQKGRLMTRRTCLMRWCNAWMCRAMAFKLLAG
ncbi:MAG: hypothetical protein QGH42_11655 [Kiritimatiellia bacterium]|jgi:hypothetical protein|nr:hypothetical protein [Kiritimatiellia bacterium]